MHVITQPTAPSSFSRSFSLDALRAISPRRHEQSALRHATLDQAALLRAAQPSTIERFELVSLAAIPGLRFEYEGNMPVPATGYRTLTHLAEGEIWTISINSDLDQPTQRFSALHVLKHIVDDPGADALYGGTRSTTAALRDAMADLFADEVLAPARFLRSQECGSLSPHELAARFEAPLETIQRQLAAANLDVPGSDAAPTPPTVDSLLTVAEACTRLRVSRWTIYELIKSGELQPIHIRTRTLFAPSELDRYLSAQQHLGGHHG